MKSVEAAKAILNLDMQVVGGRQWGLGRQWTSQLKAKHVIRTRMIDKPTNESWEKALDVYDSFVGTEWDHIPAFRSWVSDLSRSTEASGLTAVTSHETLIVSPYTRYPDWFEGRHVRLHPLRDGSVRIDKVPQRFDRHPTETWTIPLNEAERRVRILISDL